VSLSDGQLVALGQLREIQAFGRGAFEVVSVAEPDEPEGLLTVQVSVSCAGMPKATGGLPLKPRERIELRIPHDFPYRPPGFWATHTRFAGFPHVQWSRSLCLYVSPETEWNASDGMYGAIERLDMWLRHGALNQLDPAGEPLHPPAIYPTSDQYVIAEADTPAVHREPWFGFATLQRRSERRVHITGWVPLGNMPPDGENAAALLLHASMPFEYPGTVRALVSELARHGISQRQLFAALKLAALTTAADQRLFLVIGAPMRRIAGADKLEQHLAVWCLDQIATKGFRLMVVGNPDINEEVEAIMLGWAKTAKVSWCRVHEQRPAVTVRRDHDSPLSWFHGKSIALWGCGALGSYAAEFLTRTGIARITLHDHSAVSPGILARQLYDDTDVGWWKATALAGRLKRVNPDLEVSTDSSDLKSTALTSGSLTAGAGLVIDATASRTVALKLEAIRGKAPIPLVTMAAGHRAERGLVTVSQPEFTGGSLDLDRRAKIETCNRTRCAAFAKEFWPDPGTRPIFQPEPGCSSPTFIGSAADIAALAGLMLNIAALRLAGLKTDSASADFIELPLAPKVNRPPQRAGFEWRPDHLVRDPHHGYQVRIAPSALRDIRGWINRNNRVSGSDIETGGLLFGEFNEPARIVWISEVSGPPPDSTASAQGFVCGVEGTQEDNTERKTRTKGAVTFVGMWHTHPVSQPIPSQTDLGAMFDLLVAAENKPRHTLMLIVGDLATTPWIGAYVFTRHDFVLVRRRREAGSDAERRRT